MLFTRATYVMGTVATIKLYAASDAVASQHAAAAFAELRRLEDIFTNYRDSELTRMNQEAAVGPVQLSAEMFELLRASLGYSRQYEGAFDVTVGRAVRAWGFLGGGFRVPSLRERKQIRETVGAGWLRLDEEKRTVAFAKAGVEVDFGGIAKGYAAEKVARLLQTGGVERALVNVGESSYFALGPPPGRVGWPVAVLDPRPPHNPVLLLELPPFHALSTSGTYGKSFRKGGRIYSHLFDPRTAAPAALEGSATVICRSGAEAEAASKSVLLLSADRRRKLAGIRYVRLEVRKGGLLREQSPDLMAK